VALIDSGSSVNCIRLDALEKALPGSRRRLKTNDLVFRGANNSCIQCVGKIDADIHILDRTYVITMHVFKNIVQDLILGRPFLIENNISINFADYTMQFNDRINVVAVEECTMKARSQNTCIGKLKIKDCSMPSGICGIIDECSDSSSLRVNPAIVKSNADSRVIVIVRNDTDGAMHIKANQTIAEFTPIYEEEVEDLHHEPGREASVTP
jgi:hypothetical protein